MQVSLNKVFPLDGPVDGAWNLLKEIDQVAGCMPGAEITETVDDKNYKGKIKVKVGPMNLVFNGEIEVQDIDGQERKVHLIAKGQDSKGTSSASMDLTAQVGEGESSGSALTGDADVTVNGKLANFGGRMMTQVADQVLSRFADNFRIKLAASDSPSDEPSQDAVETEVKEINGLKFAWDALIGFIKSFFGSKA